MTEEEGYLRQNRKCICDGGGNVIAIEQVMYLRQSRKYICDGGGIQQLLTEWYIGSCQKQNQSTSASMRATNFVIHDKENCPKMTT